MQRAGGEGGGLGGRWAGGPRKGRGRADGMGGRGQGLMSARRHRKKPKPGAKSLLSQPGRQAQKLPGLDSRLTRLNSKARPR